MGTNNYVTKIKELRSRSGYSQEELALRSELSLRTIQRIESGETDPRGDSLRRISAALGVTVDELADRPAVKDRSFLVLVTLSAISFIVFPLMGFIFPLILWFPKKGKMESLDVTAKKIINFEITWNIFLFIGFILIALFSFVNRADSATGILPAMITGYLKDVIIWFFFAYVLNIIFIISNAIRIKNDKRSFYFPYLAFIRK